jgi:cytosine/uracil/thiamine/allantoin permease
VFTKIGRIVGFLAIALGLAAIVGSFAIAPDVLAPDFNRNSLNQSTLWLSQGSVLLFFGLVLGVLCEISLKLDK